jgi:two-component system cell cycle response regulator
VNDAIIPKPIKVLVVENNRPKGPPLLRATINHPHLGSVESQRVRHLHKALRLLLQEKFDLVLLDLFLPDSEGLETFYKISEHTPEVPVIVVSETEDKFLALEVLREGAQDYLVKSELDTDSLQRALLYALERHRYRSMLENLTLRDELTGLLNRRGFLSLAGQHLKIAQRSKWKILFLFADLDGLKRINDNFGHLEGDNALRGVAQIFEQTFRSSDLVARIGGDEFIVLALKVGQSSVKKIARRLHENIEHFNSQATNYKISLSFGAEIFDPAENVPLEEMIIKVDQALYKEKQKRKKGPFPSPLLLSGM